MTCPCSSATGIPSRAKPPDHTALAGTLLSLSPLLSKRTILEQLPWVKDAEEELRRKAEETMETEE